MFAFLSRIEASFTFAIIVSPSGKSIAVRAVPIGIFSLIVSS